MTAKKSAAGKGFSFEAAMERLQKIVRSLESGELSLEDNLRNFEEGVGLVRQCRDFLSEARSRVEVLIGDDGAGRPLIETYEEDVDDDD